MPIHPADRRGPSMRVLAGSILSLTLSLVALSQPARAQTYDPRYPVCMKVYEGGRFGGGEWNDCSFTSLPQCRATASGRAAMCIENPYFVPDPDLPRRRHRHAH